MFAITNKICVCVTKDNKAILKFLKCNIKTTACIGRNGVTYNKKEGDGKTPLGEFELGLILSTHTNTKGITIDKEMYWVDDPKSKYYNQLVNTTKIEKDWESAEHLIDYPIQYEYLIEIKANPHNIRNKGSAIFLHCTNKKATQGCVAVPKEIMEKIIDNIDKETKIEIKKELF